MTALTRAQPPAEHGFPTLSYLQAVERPSEFVDHLRHALLSVGFFNLVDIERVLPDWSLRWQEAFAVSRTFFDLPLERKNRIAMINSRHFRGYAANRQETTAGLPDWREQIDFGPESDPVIPYPPRPQDAIELSLYGPNLYPQEPSEFAVAIAQYRERVTRIAETLVRLIGEALSPSPELFSGLFLARDPSRHPPYARLKVVRYPPVAPDETGFGVGAHRDGGGLTLLAQDDSGGLQVQTFEGDWLDVAPIPHALVVNVGQVLERMSANAFPATTHRVLKTVRATPRLSIPFFFSPPLTTRLVPLGLDQLHDVVRDRVERGAERTVVSEVERGDLHAEVYGKSAWAGIKRSHRAVWDRYYGEDRDRG